MAQTNGTNNTEEDEKAQQQSDGVGRPITRGDAVGRPITRSARQSDSNATSNSQPSTSENLDDESDQV